MNLIQLVAWRFVYDEFPALDALPWLDGMMASWGLGNTLNDISNWAHVRGSCRITFAGRPSQILSNAKAVDSRSIHSGLYLVKIFIDWIDEGSAGTYLSLTCQRPCMHLNSANTVFCRVDGETCTEIEVLEG